jgi:SAM-dependent methyltransferase
MTDSHIITTQWGTQAKTFAAMPSEVRTQQMQYCAEIMADIKANTGIDVYLSYGCLLGAQRNGKMISHDFDIDLAFHVNATTKEDVVTECRRLIRYLEGVSHRVILETNGHFKIGKWYKTGIYMTIEFFVSWNVEDEFFLYFGVPGAPIAEDIMPLSTIEIEGVSMPAPNNPPALLAAIYGPDWATPNPGFKYDNIDWSPFQGFSVSNNQSYWDGYYAEKKLNDVWAEYPSQFAAFCASEIKAKSKIMDFGCGNGRDSLFLAQIGHDVLACDYSQQAVDLVKAKADVLGLSVEAEILNIYDVSHVQKIEQNKVEIFDVIYSRFVMHAITRDGQNRFLRMAKKALTPDGKILLEFRNSEDVRKEIGDTISEDERSDGHYRRFIDTDSFLDDVKQLGLDIAYLAHGTGFAKFRSEDPNVTRVILTHTKENTE